MNLIASILTLHPAGRFKIASSRPLRAYPRTDRKAIWGSTVSSEAIASTAGVQASWAASMETRALSSSDICSTSSRGGFSF